MQLQMILGIVLAGVLIFSFSNRAAAASVQPVEPWEQITSTAKQEGKVTVIGPQGVDTRTALTEGFQKNHPEIQLEYTGMPYDQVTPKVVTELSAGRKATDVIIIGTTTALQAMLPAKAIIPMRPFLAGPATRNLAEWRGGKLTFSDEAGLYNLVFSFYRKAPFVYNSNLVSAKEIRTYKDLLAPKWKGKMGIRNPTRPGGGLASVMFWYSHPELGKTFVQEMFTQNLAIFDDDRQFLDSVAREKLRLGIGLGDVLTIEMIRKGLPIKYADSKGLREGAYLTSGIGAVVVVRDTPHPNAAKVYLDYLLSFAGQLTWSQASGQASMRRDVSMDHLPPELRPEEGLDYPEIYKETYVKLTRQVVEFVKTLGPR
jgi:iron(III) transport system substrate-binding protein